MSHTLTGDPSFRWIVSAIFGVSIAAYVYIVVVQRDRWTSAVTHLLHLAMSVAMVLMVWGVGLNLPTAAPTIVFLLAGGWFVHLAARLSYATGEWLTNGYSAVTMAAMAWMYAVMAGILPGQRGHSPYHSQPGSLAMNASDMQMPAHAMPHTAAGSEWITTLNWIATIGFTIAALYWSSSYVAKRGVNAVADAPQPAGLEPLYHAITAGGTALMFGALL